MLGCPFCLFSKHAGANPRDFFLLGQLAFQSAGSTAEESGMKAARYKELGNKDVRIGQGTYGSVHAAWDKTEERLVAIKVQKSRSSTATREMMFFQSIERHPHVLPIFDAFNIGDDLKLVFEYCSASLQDWYKRTQGFLNFDVAERCGRQVLQGLAHMHKNNVAHRDLSLANVLISEGGSCKIADMGLAVCASSFVMERPVQAPVYRAPEACVGFTNLPYPQKVLDIWSYGTIVAALWSATLIFQVKQVDVPTNEQCLRKIAERLGPPQQAWPGVTSVREWSKFLPELGNVSSAGLRATLLSTEAVKRPLTNRLDVVDFIDCLLRWDPEQRLSAEKALDHAIWGPKPTASPQDCFPQLMSQTGSEPSEETRFPQLVSQTGSEPSERHAPSANAASVSAASEASAPAPPPDKRCTCRGNCNILACKNAKRSAFKRGVRQDFYCNFPAKRDSSVCEACSCYRLGCDRPSYGQRLCTTHGKEVGRINDKTHYDSPSGKRKFPPEWNWELKMIATHAWMLQYMCPMDARSFFRAASAIAGGEPTATQGVDGHQLLRMWVGACLKLPQAVESWVVALGNWGQPGVSAGGPRDAKGYAEAMLAIVPAIVPCDAWQQRNLQTGNQGFWLGPGALIKKLNMVRDPKRRKVCKVADGHNDIPYLGAASDVCHEEDVWRVLVALADSFDLQQPMGLPLPTGPLEARNFVRVLSEWLATFPKTFGHDSKAGYVKKHIVRKLVMWARQKQPSAWRDFTVSEIIDISPDQYDLLNAVPKTWTAADLEMKFGLDAIMIPCWACLFHGVPAAKRPVFEYADSKLLCTVLKDRQAHGGHEPNLQVICTAHA